MDRQPAPLEASNPLGIDGIEFIEYATTRPQALGAQLEQLGFVATARHRSREVTLYRQGSMHLIVNADRRSLPQSDTDPQATVIGAVALRVRDASQAYGRALDLGAWPIPTRAGVMELNIPGVHGPGDSILYFVDSFRDFSIYDVDFRPIPGAPPTPPALAGMHLFGVVQAIDAGRTPEWTDFYRQLMAFRPLPEGRWFGAVRKGTLLESPCRGFYIQLVEPPEGAGGLRWEEQLIRVGFGVPRVAPAVRALQERGVAFLEPAVLADDTQGALTRLVQGVSFELVASHLGGDHA